MSHGWKALISLWNSLNSHPTTIGVRPFSMSRQTVLVGFGRIRSDFIWLRVHCANLDYV
jgi:hypothetical protein